MNFRDWTIESRTLASLFEAGEISFEEYYQQAEDLGPEPMEGPPAPPTPASPSSLPPTPDPYVDELVLSVAGLDDRREAIAIADRLKANGTWSDDQHAACLELIASNSDGPRQIHD